jgi:hypothetical protein
VANFYAKRSAKASVQTHRYLTGILALATLIDVTQIKIILFL